MPEYLYQHPETKEVKSVFQGIHDTHVYEEEGIEWIRLFTAPQLNTVGTIDPFDKNQFVNATANTKGNYGDLLDRSKDLSEQRKALRGEDAVQNTFFDNYSKERGGRPHLKDGRKRKVNKGIEVDFD